MSSLITPFYDYRINVGGRISEFLDAIKSSVNPSVQMVVCVLPSNKKDMYDAIKKQCCVVTPVLSQMITARILGKPSGLMSVVSKIAIQLNCKLGGEAWAVEIPVCMKMYEVMYLYSHKRFIFSML